MHVAHRSDPCECSLPTEAAADLSKRVSEATIPIGACLLTFAVADHALAFLLAIFYARRPGLELGLGLGQSRTCHAGEADRHNGRHHRRPDEMHFAHRIAPFS
jgi:hypothetical protein